MKKLIDEELDEKLVEQMKEDFLYMIHRYDAQVEKQRKNLIAYQEKYAKRLVEVCNNFKNKGETK